MNKIIITLAALALGATVAVADESDSSFAERASNFSAAQSAPQRADAAQDFNTGRTSLARRAPTFGFSAAEQELFDRTTRSDD